MASFSDGVAQDQLAFSVAVGVAGKVFITQMVAGQLQYVLPVFGEVTSDSEWYVLHVFEIVYPHSRLPSGESDENLGCFGSIVGINPIWPRG